MKYHVLTKSVVYEGCPIYVRNTGETWEYLTVINNEIYTAHIIARKHLTQRLFGKPYTAKQSSDCTQYMLAMAQTTIDTILGIEHSKKVKPFNKD